MLTQAATVWDVRTPQRYRGEIEPIDPVAGHLPGARNLPDADLHFADGRFGSIAELRRALAQVRSGDVIYCGSGLRGSPRSGQPEQLKIHATGCGAAW